MKDTRGKKMKLSEYTVLRDVFENAFGFMLNRIAEGYPDCPDFQGLYNIKEDVEERCWNEFMVALEEMGIELGDLKSQ